jgi:hypothetical protein
MLTGYKPLVDNCTRRFASGSAIFTLVSHGKKTNVGVSISIKRNSSGPNIEN